MAIRYPCWALVSLATIGLASLALAQSDSPPPAAPFEASAISAEALVRLLGGPSRVLLFDTRTAPEFEVSHIRNAIRIEPGPGALSRLVPHLREAQGVDVVLYCTIGTRSAGVANDALDGVVARGARSVQVLDLGLIGWVNADLPLVDANESPTSFVHPFDAAMAKGLTQPERARFGAGH